MVVELWSVFKNIVSWLGPPPFLKGVEVSENWKKGVAAKFLLERR